MGRREIGVARRHEAGKREGWQPEGCRYEYETCGPPAGGRERHGERDQERGEASIVTGRGGAARQAGGAEVSAKRHARA